MILFSFLLTHGSTSITTFADFLQDTYSLFGSSVLIYDSLSYEMCSLGVKFLEGTLALWQGGSELGSANEELKDLGQIT